MVGTGRETAKFLPEKPAIVAVFPEKTGGNDPGDPEHQNHPAGTDLPQWSLLMIYACVCHTSPSWRPFFSKIADETEFVKGFVHTPFRRMEESAICRICSRH